MKSEAKSANISSLESVFIEGKSYSLPTRQRKLTGITEFCNVNLKRNKKILNKVSLEGLVVRSPGFEPGIISLEG